MCQASWTIALMPCIFRVESLTLSTHRTHPISICISFFTLECLHCVTNWRAQIRDTITFFEENMQNPWIFNGIVWLFFLALFAVFIVYLHHVCECMRLLRLVSLPLSSCPFPSNGCRMWCINGNTYLFILSFTLFQDRSIFHEPPEANHPFPYHIFFSLFQSQAFYDGIRLKSHFRMLQADVSVMWWLSLSLSPPWVVCMQITAQNITD